MANNLNYPTYTNPYNNLQKINGDFQFTEQIKDYAMNPIWKGQYSSLWNTVSGAAEEIGQVVYEHIANYVQNIDDIDTCGLDRLYSIAKELDVEHVFSYNLQYPPELGDIMDLLSIGKSYLLTSGYVFHNDTIKAMYSQLSGISGNIPDDVYISGFMEPVISGNLTYYSNFYTQDTSLSGLSEEYRGFMDDIYSDPQSTYDMNTSGAIIEECVHTLRNIALKASYQRETLKNVAKKHAMVGTASIIEKIIAEYILRSYTKKRDWRLYVELSGDTKPAGITQQYVMEQNIPSLDDVSKYFNVDMIEYYDTTEYLNISAMSPPVYGISGYTTGIMISSNVDVNGYIVTGEYYTTGIAQYGQLSAESIVGGNPRYWQDTYLQNSMIDSENTSAELESFYKNIGMSGSLEHSMNLLNRVYENYAVSGYDRTGYIPELAGTISPSYTGSLTGNIPLSAYSVLPTSLTPIQKKYIGTMLSGDVPAANIKNQLYPTIAAQPFIWNLVEKAFEEFPSILRIILLSQQAQDEFFDQQVDPSGNIIDSWKYFNHEFTGYNTYYEQSVNLDFKENMNPAIDRDGPFDVDALSSLIYDYGDISGRYSHIGRDFNISGTMPRIDMQLDRFRTDIIGLSAQGIYQYSWDQYDNHYFLYKDGDTVNDLGTIWVRYKNHPLPFPMSFGDKSSMNLQQVYMYGGLDAYQLNSITTSTSAYTAVSGRCNDFDINGSTMWVMGQHSLSGTTVTVFRNDYVDFTRDVSILKDDVFSVVFKHDSSDVPRFFVIPGGINNYIGAYTHDNQLIFAMIDDWVADSGKFKGTFFFKHYNLKTRNFEDTSLDYVEVPGLPDRYVPSDGKNIFKLAASEDVVTIAYESVNTTSTSGTFANMITTVDFLKDTLDSTDVKIMEWNEVNNAI